MFSNIITLAALDAWKRPRCQQIDTYVDEYFQCALVAGHDGDCDPLPIWPDVDGSMTLAELERLYADDGVA